ncbi:MAG: hypothetical protein V1743_06955 [Nanoarchaeota archaeon]
MVSITVSVPNDTRTLMKQFPEVNWSGFVKKSIEEKARELKELEKLKRNLRTEQETTDWAVKLQHASRQGRIDALRKKGLL